MKVVILAGGLGTRISEETKIKPKPMVEIGDKPILWHIMKIYSHYGYNEFIICLGYKGHYIKEWFTNHKKKKYLKKLSKKKMNDFLHLDGNAQSFRIVSQIENNMFLGGMSLTFATLGTLIKYPYSSANCKISGKSKFNYFQSEKDFFKSVFNELNLVKEDGTYKRHPLSFLMEAADDICYGLLDLQDAFELNIIDENDVRKIFELFCAEEIVSKVYEENISKLKKVSKLVAISIDKLARHVMEVFENNYDEIISDNQPNDLI